MRHEQASEQRKGLTLGDLDNPPALCAKIMSLHHPKFGDRGAGQYTVWTRHPIRPEWIWTASASCLHMGAQLALSTALDLPNVRVIVLPRDISPKTFADAWRMPKPDSQIFTVFDITIRVVFKECACGNGCAPYAVGDISGSFLMPGVAGLVKHLSNLGLPFDFQKLEDDSREAIAIKGPDGEMMPISSLRCGCN